MDYVVMKFKDKAYKINKFSVWAQRECIKRYGDNYSELFLKPGRDDLFCEIMYMLSEELQADYKTEDIFLKAIVSLNERKVILETAWGIIQDSISTDLSSEQIAEMKEGKKKITIKQAIVNTLMKLFMRLIKRLGGRIYT